MFGYSDGIDYYLVYQNITITVEIRICDRSRYILFIKHVYIIYSYNIIGIHACRHVVSI